MPAVLYTLRSNCRRSWPLSSDVSKGHHCPRLALCGADHWAGADSRLSSHRPCRFRMVMKSGPPTKFCVHLEPRQRSGAILGVSLLNRLQLRAGTASCVMRAATSATIVRDDGREQTFRVVGEDEADPAQGSICQVSPLARSMFGKRVGDVV
jgi:hypothetical protein